MSIKKPVINFHPPVYHCQRATKPFTLDGNIRKPFWEDAPFTDDFVDIEGDVKPTPRYKTRAKMLWDDENLYVAALLEGDEIWATLTERDSVIYHDNDFEVFIDPDSDTHNYYELEINAINTVWDLLLTKPYRDGGFAINCWDIKDLQTAVHINGEVNNPAAHNSYWSVEIVMPFSSLQECAPEKRPPVIGEYWRMNFSRVHWSVDQVEGTYRKRINPDTNQPYPENNWVWAPTGLINIHYPELWGFVFFVNEKGEGKYEIPKDEVRKWILRQVYYAQSEYYDKNGSYAKDLTLLHLTDIDTSNMTVQVTEHSYEVISMDNSGIGKLCLFSDGIITYL